MWYDVTMNAPTLIALSVVIAASTVAVVRSLKEWHRLLVHGRTW
jgi:hypothetical protein